MKAFFLFFVISVSFNVGLFGQVLKETVTDIDGNVYHIVTIGKQVWMQENLQVTHYRNGDSIPNVKYSQAWVDLLNSETGAYCAYYNSLYNNKTYGMLYNCYAVIDHSKLCPSGWHVPSDKEWTTLANYLGGDSIAGDKLKEQGTTHWNYPNTGATNETGFTALPGGIRSLGFFEDIGENGSWWSSTKDYSHTGLWLQKPYDRYLYRYLKFDKKELGRSRTTLQDGYSVRCIRDSIK
jgi:uncharacterized protein (TIGR02145 family)